MESPLPVQLPSIGDWIDTFELEEAIGAGGMGAVYRALDKKLDRHVALKLLPPEQTGDPEVVQRFYQEARAAARLDHDNIARVFTIGQDGPYHYIAFEYIEGTTVRQRVERNGPLPVSEAINYTLQIAEALVHASERGVVHRDIKPSNIIVSPHGRAKLVDMGLARQFERGGDDGLTQSGMTLGTFDYISPEQARDPRDVDVRSDLYSLGCTLFHMLTGRPPFPEGTVLQKLLQHQEETPPDVRSLNPAVPPDLATILVKLMAKDRDRRHQSPEQLVRDLLTVAGTLGLRSVSPEGLVWLSTEEPAEWEKHLVWGVPTFVFAAIILALTWWGQDSAAPVTTAGNEVLPKVIVQPPVPAQPDRPASKAATTPVSGGRSFPPETAATDPSAPSSAPREIPVDPSEDLLAAIASAPAHATLVLSDVAPYLINSVAEGNAPADRLTRRDLTIKADTGAHPVIRVARERPRDGPVREALLDFHGGRVTLDGLEFVLDRSETVGPQAAVRGEDIELTLLRCVFRHKVSPINPAKIDDFATEQARVAAVQVRSGDKARARGDRPPAVTLDQCHFDGDQVGLLASGPVDILVRDCTMAGAGPAFWFDNSKAAGAVTADLTLRHVSILAGVGPVFRFDGTEPRVRVEDSVVAGAGEEEATLVLTDNPDDLSWRGRSNLYSQVETYLQVYDGGELGEAVTDASKWAETADAVRESGSLFENAHVWDEPDPTQALAREASNPTRAFRLASGRRETPGVGVRRGPFGSLPPAAIVSVAMNSTSAAGTNPPGLEDRPDRRPARNGAEAPRPTAAPAQPATRAPSELRAPSQPMTAVPGDEAAAPEDSAPPPMPSPPRVNDMPEMPVMPPVGREKPGTASGDVGPAGSNTEDATPANDTNPNTNLQPPPMPQPMPVADPGGARPAQDTVKTVGVVLRAAGQLLDALREPNARGGLLRVAADADWELPSSLVRTSGSWRIQAEPGPTRPKLRFVPTPGELKAASAWSSMIELRAGSLQLLGIDVVLPRNSAPREGRWAAFSVWPATELSLTACTVTVEGEKAVSAVVSVAAGDLANEEEPGVNAPGPSASTVHFTDALLRAGGDLIDVAAGRRLVLDVSNSVVSTAGSVLHAHGLPRGEAVEKINLSLKLNQVTARAAGGLVQLESAPGQPDLPFADVDARDSIFATTPQGAPLLRLDGQDSVATVRDRVVWKGRSVGYHQINAYRRDQSARVGAAPNLYDRQSWIVAVGARESGPVYGDLKFRSDWDASRAAWTLRREDVELAPDSPMHATGSDLHRIPDPPRDL